MTITETLAERGNRYGCFKEHARITQNIKRAMADSPNWGKLSDDKREALEMLAHKVGRILNGDPEYHDSWHDMEGYSRLVAEGLVAESDPLTPQAIINLALKNLGENDDPPITLTNETRVVWRGGLYPAISPNKMVRVKLRGGVEFSNERLAKFVSWQHTGGDADVVEYIYKNTSEDDGWIQWDKGWCPVQPKTIVDIRQRNGCEHHRVAARACRWHHYIDPTDIIAYRVCEAAVHDSAYGWIEWTTCINLPVPVGTVIDLKFKSGKIIEKKCIQKCDPYWYTKTGEGYIISYRICEQK